MRRVDPTRAVAYVRVSTDEQAIGPAAQRAAIETWAAGAGVTVVGWWEDLGVSGGTPIDDRPGLMAALSDLRRQGAGLLVAAKRDRVARDVAIAARLEGRLSRVRARLVTTDVGEGSPRVLPQILDALAEHERAILGQRTAAAMAVKRGRGEQISRFPPYGYRHEAGRVVPDEVEQARVRVIRARLDAGDAPSAIVAQLNAAGIPARGQRWHKTTIERLARRDVP